MNITLLDGRVANTDDIDFHQDTFHFFWNGEDITNLIKRNDKRKFVGFNDEQENLRVYQENHPGAPETGSTSVTSNFFSQLFTDPLDAPAEFFSDAVASAKEAVKNNLTTVIVVSGLVLLGGFYLLSKRK